MSYHFMLHAASSLHAVHYKRWVDQGNQLELVAIEGPSQQVCQPLRKVW